MYILVLMGDVIGDGNAVVSPVVDHSLQQLQTFTTVLNVGDNAKLGGSVNVNGG